MTAIFNRSYPIQVFSEISRSGAAVVAPTPPQLDSGSATASVAFVATATGSSTRTGSATASVSFTSTATGSTTRTGSATASVTFAATATGTQIEQGGITIPSEPEGLGGNIMNSGQSMSRAGSW
jgi:hypothetical protein